MHTYNIEIHHIFSSPAHNYFTRKKFHVGDAPHKEHSSVTLTPHQGIVGDRFEFATYPLTLFSLEVAKEVSYELQLPLELPLFRRNIIVSGIHLNSLIGEKFFINGVLFEALSHCAPCPWMNAVMKKGAYNLMKGRGGLRIQPLEYGELRVGLTKLISSKEITANPLERLKKPSLPT